VPELLSLGVGAMVTVPMKKCSYCGTEYPDDVIACPVDHTPLGEQPASRSDGHQVPVSLSFVSFFFLFAGVMSALWLICGIITLVRLGTSGTSLTFPILFHFLWHPFIVGFWIFFGLRRFSRGWRICALVVLWWIFIAFLWVLAYVFLGPRLHLSLPDQRMVGMTMSWLFVKVGLAFVLVGWQYRVLTRSDIRSLFYGQTSEADT
jgi:hypothetical protein